MNALVRSLLRAAVLLWLLSGFNVHAMMEADKFVGAWRLLSTTFTLEDGTPTESPYGPQPQGVLMYDAHGTMSAQLSQTGRKPFAVNDRFGGTPDEIKAAFETYQAYTGTYKVDEKERVVSHTVTQALLPNWIGSVQRRAYKFQDGRLILRTPPMQIGGKRIIGELTWEKIKIGQ